MTKGIRFIGSSLHDLREFPQSTRRTAGYQLDKLQRGDEPDDWKPMTTIGEGVAEIRVRDATGAYRMIYVARFAEAIYVLHAFKKKSQKTAPKDIELATNRYRALLRNRS